MRSSNDQIVQDQVVEEFSDPIEEEIVEENQPVISIETPSESLNTAYFQEITGETDLYRFTFSTEGAVLTSLELLEHEDKDQLVNMVYPGDTGRGAFEISFGQNTHIPITQNFHFVENDDPNIYQFYQDFQVQQSDGSLSPSFKLIKTYRFIPDEYMMELVVTIENSENSFIPLNYNGYAYTLAYGPQIGPSFTKFDGRYSYRRFVSYDDGKLTVWNGRSGTKTGEYNTQEMLGWAGIIGKYFGFAVITDGTRYEYGWSNEPVSGLETPAFFYLSRPTIDSSRNSDIYRFYIGPKDRRTLELYNNSSDNAFGYANLELEGMAESGGALGWLEFLLKKLLELFYMLVPNYGVAIILMTVLIKALLFPITHKSYESTSKMSAIQPKMKEIQDKYKEDPQRMNKELSMLYKKEGVNPMGGCLPMVLQMPILFAVYGMLNKYFDLRGAVFIPGWINDLSAPESIYTFSNFTIPFNIGSDIRLLPIIYVASQIFSMKFTQAQQPATAGQSGMQQKMFMYMMPLMFFFILYNVSSGLLIYWIVMNVLTTAQQMTINHLKKKKANSK